MKNSIKIIPILFLFFGFLSFAQTARVKGIILDETSNPVDNVNVSSAFKNTITDETGFYELIIPANRKVSLVFSHTSLKKVTVNVELKPNEDYELNIVMNDKAEGLGEVIVTSKWFNLYK